MLIIIINLLCLKISRDIFDEYTHLNSIFLFFWSIQVAIGCLFSRGTGLNLYGFIWIISISVLFFTGGIFTNRIFKNTTLSKKDYNLTKKSNQSLKLLIFYFTIGIFHTLYVLKLYGFSIEDISSYESLRTIIVKIVVSRYNGESINDLVKSNTLVFVYLTPLVAGFQYYFSDKMTKYLLVILSILPCFFVLLIENTKAPVVAASILFLIGLYTSHLHTFGKSIRITSKILIICTLCTFLILTILYISMLIRIGRYDSSAISHVNKSFINYAVGHIFAFDNWFSDTENISLTLGKNTFSGIVDFLGISSRDNGLYLNYYINDFIHTNVYTYFRPSLEDFGVYTASFFFFSLGTISSITFNIVKGGGGPASITILSFIMFYCFFYPASAWAYMSLTTCFIYFYFHLKFLNILHIRKQKIIIST